jgi:hypothetical protein
MQKPAFFANLTRAIATFHLPAKTPCGGAFFCKFIELLAKVTRSVIPAKAGIQNCLKILDSGSRFACPE